MKKYMSILVDMESKIQEGRYRPGQKLPSVRSAAQQYGCSISTVIRAYAELEERHTIYSVSQSGYYVVQKESDPDNRDESLIDFASASPDVNVFPYLDFQHCLNKAIDTYKYHLFTYGDGKGMDKLRHTLVSHFADSQVFTRPERIMVTSGAQQAMEILAKMPFPNGKSVILVEQPSYNNFLHFLESENVPVVGIPRSTAGIDIGLLEEKFKTGHIKFFYTMPRYHNPLGTSLRVEERKAIAALASQYDVFVVEDDYMADLGDERGFDPVYAYNQTSHIIYLKSFSKIIFPGLRLGAVVLPESLLEEFYAYKKYGDASLLSQAALEIYISNGMYERHKQKIYRQYETRMVALDSAVQLYGGTGLIEVVPGNGGIYKIFKLPHNVNLERLIKRLEERSILVVSGKPFYLSQYLERDKFIRISISRVSQAQIEAGVQTIVEEVKRELGNRW
ncbi:DNA-binding transcriptional MocR family regulator [Paenibacillus sp. LBL]|uniref:aminotransferase-like domain-containing protein n=1 Tax=Paenibacillus sp. LBL TaxID=2940563 RepID=UPI002473D5C8|nr:PLP-dependent aminotransferase family protein [Paenibacillus sp. LBL]MDH6670061.1 DNA-binding transcriptional MocR family regulator [Paenibacillus sp. LBL]